MGQVIVRYRPPSCPFIYRVVSSVNGLQIGPKPFRLGSDTSQSQWEEGVGGVRSLASKSSSSLIGTDLRASAGEEEDGRG